jgi:hypothetical protein
LGVWALGLGLIVLGVLFLLDTTGLLDAGAVFSTFWPLVLVFWGAWMLRRERGRSLAGLLVLLLGLGFQAEELGWIEGGWLGRYWPVALIVVGLAILVGVRWPRTHPPEPQAETRADEWIDTLAVLRERDQRVTSSAWRGGRVVAVLGEAQVDLREATPHASGAQLRATAVLGTVQLKIPEGWSLSVSGTPLLGSIEDLTAPPPQKPRARSRGMSRVEIVATAVLGQVEIEH